MPLYGAALLVFLVLIAWAPIIAFREPLGVLVFALLVAGTASPGSGDAEATGRP